MVNSARPSPSHSSLASRLEFSSGNTRRVSLPVGLAARAALWKDCATQVGEAARVESTPMRTFRVAILLRIVTETRRHLHPGAAGRVYDRRVRPTARAACECVVLRHYML